MLSQTCLANGKWHFVVFFSKFLSLVEYNYKIHDKKMLTIIWLYKSGTILLKELDISSRSGLITRIWSISYGPNSSIKNKHNGHYTLFGLTFYFTTNLASLWANRIHFHAKLTTAPMKTTTLISPFLILEKHKGDLWYLHLRKPHLWALCLYDKGLSRPLFLDVNLWYIKWGFQVSESKGWSFLP